jgi:hypothetical protein
MPTYPDAISRLPPEYSGPDCVYYSCYLMAWNPWILDTREESFLK